MLFQKAIFSFARRSYSKRCSAFSSLNSKYKTLSSDDVSYFSSILSPHEIITDPSELQVYNTDWLKKYIGRSQLALKPNTTEKVSKILKYCNDNSIAIVPQGGNTGLVGGSVPVNDEIILSLTNLNKILDFDSNTAVLRCESGCVLEVIDQYLADYGYEVPLDLGAKGSCHIGGNVATNAGGTRFIKFGPFKSYVLGLEVVLPNGEILNMESNILKDNTGLDLKQMFIGSEGILGVITKVNVLVPPVDKFKQVLYIQCESFEKILEINRLVRAKLGRNLGALEFTDAYAYETVQKYLPDVVKPFNESDLEKYYVLVEVVGQEPLDNLVESLYTDLSDQNLVLDCIASENDSQRIALWKLRENVAVACNHLGIVFKYDVSLPVEKMAELVHIVRGKVGSLGYTMGYGHLGDGNLHLNVACADHNKLKDVENILEPFVFEWLSKLNGSISAEHGLGKQKPKYLHFSKDKKAIEYMIQLKSMFDPKGIMNPYKMLPQSV